MAKRQNMITRYLFAGVITSLLVGALLFFYRIEVGTMIWNTLRLDTLALPLSNDAELAVEIGNYYFNTYGDGMYDLEKAERYFKQALEIDSRAPLAWYQLGRIDFLNGRFFSAIEKFNKNIELHNSIENQAVMRTHYMRGLTYGYMKWFESAEADFLRLLGWHKDKPPTPEEWALYVDLSWIYFQQGKYEEIEELTKEGLARFPDNPWVLNMRGLSLINLNRSSEAQPLFEKALEEAQKLTEEDWARAYPGNDPRIAAQGLASMITSLEFNFLLTVDK